MVIFSSLIPRVGLAWEDQNEYEEAAKKSAEAIYIQSGVRENLQYQLEVLKQKVPRDYQILVENSLVVVDIVVKRRIEVKYEF